MALLSADESDIESAATTGLLAKEPLDRGRDAIDLADQTGTFVTGAFCEPEMQGE